jgi:hypothetical protein
MSDYTMCNPEGRTDGLRQLVNLPFVFDLLHSVVRCIFFGGGFFLSFFWNPLDMLVMFGGLI